VDVMSLSTASMYELLEMIYWNIMIPANVETTQTQKVTASYHSHAEMIPANDDAAATFCDYIKSHPEHIQWLLLHIECVCPKW
jgi:hypothetical protein